MINNKYKIIKKKYMLGCFDKIKVKWKNKNMKEL